MSAPASTSSAASRKDFGVVFVYWKRPVSVTSAMYNGSAISGVSSTPSASNTSRSTSPVDDEVDGAEAAVVVVVVDVDDELRPIDRSRVRPHPVGLRAVDRDERALLHV